MLLEMSYIKPRPEGGGNPLVAPLLYNRHWTHYMYILYLQRSGDQHMYNIINL